MASSTQAIENRRPCREVGDRRKGEDGRLPPALDVSVVDALLRFGWVLRQVDLFYGLEPDRR